MALPHKGGKYLCLQKMLDFLKPLYWLISDVYRSIDSSHCEAEFSSTQVFECPMTQ